MSQILRPNSDLSVSGFFYSSGTSAYVLIDEVTADDSDYMYTMSNGGYFIVGVEAPSKIPTVDTGHFIHIRGKYTGNLRTRQVALYQATTLIAAFTWTMSSSYANYTFALTEAQAVNITDYSVLRIKVLQTSYAFNDYIYVSQAYLEIPDVIGIGLEMGCSF